MHTRDLRNSSDLNRDGILSPTDTAIALRLTTEQRL